MESQSRTRRAPRLTIRWMMFLVAYVALCAAWWAHMRRWEGRRAELYRQRDVTRAVFQEARADVAAAGLTASELRDETELSTYTRHWTRWLQAWEDRDGARRLLIRARVHGSVSEFALEPITVETFGSPLDDAWLRRLLAAYRAEGWRYRQQRGQEPFRLPTEALP